MDLKEYGPLALRTAVDNGRDENLMHAAMGIAGEGGEVVDHIKKVMFNGRILDVAHVIEELGDSMWYANLMVHTLGTTWDHVLSVNIRKLEARYPELKFDVSRGLNRDLDAEKAAMGVV